MNQHDEFAHLAEADEQEREKQRKESVQQREQEDIADLKWLMNRKQGRRFMYRMLDRAGVFQLSFNTNAMIMSFNEGRRNEGLAQLHALMTACPDNYMQMLKENKDD